MKASSDIKRVILRTMEAPIKQLGMDSRELLDFIRTSPKGSETLVSYPKAICFFVFFLGTDLTMASSLSFYRFLVTYI